MEKNMDPGPSQGGTEIKEGKTAKQICRTILIGVLAAVILTAGILGYLRWRQLEALCREPEVDLTCMDTAVQLSLVEAGALWKNPEAVILAHPELTEGEQTAIRYLCRNYFPEGYSEARCYYYMDMNKLTEAETQKAIECCQPDFKAQALRKALRLLSQDDYGKAKLAKRLEEDRFTQEEIDYAIENCGADWDYQAELAVKSYLYRIGISRQGLVSVLESEGHAPETVEQAIEKLDPDWNREALQDARAFIKDVGIIHPKRKLYEKLLFADYTPEQAQYAVDRLLP